MKYRILALVALIFLQVFPVLAHGDEARIELNLTQASPGATIDVRGTGFAPLEIVAFTLVKSGTQRQIGDFEAGIDGDFALGLLLPFDLEYGEYEFHAAVSHHSVSVPLSIVPDKSGKEESGQRDEEEPLLAPMPTFRPAVVTAPVAQAPVEATPASTENRNLIALAALVGAGIILVFSIMRKRVR